jgi:hypothetical protein
MTRSAMTEAVAHFQRGLDVLAALPDGLGRRQQELDLQFALGGALAAARGYSAADVGESIDRARILAEQLDRPEYLVPLLRSQLSFHLLRSEHKMALSLAEQIEKIGDTRNDVATQLCGRLAKGWICWFLGELVAARALLEQCHALADPAKRAAGGERSVDPMP